jgi:hypothetical protein
MINTRAPYFLSRLLPISSKGFPDQTVKLPLRFGFQYNEANQRIWMDIRDNHCGVYEYDALGKVEVASHRLSTGRSGTDGAHHAH